VRRGAGPRPPRHAVKTPDVAPYGLWRPLPSCRTAMPSIPSPWTRKPTLAGPTTGLVGRRSIRRKFPDRTGTEYRDAIDRLGHWRTDAQSQAPCSGSYLASRVRKGAHSHHHPPHSRKRRRMPRMVSDARRGGAARPCGESSANRRTSRRGQRRPGGRSREVSLARGSR
jgi:hypothetical protein